MQKLRDIDVPESGTLPKLTAPRVERRQAPAPRRRMRLLPRYLQLALDLLVLVSAFLIAYLLRFDFVIPGRYIWRGSIQLPFVVLIQLLALGLAGVYAYIWCFVGMAEVKAFLIAAVLSVIPLTILRFLMHGSFELLQVPFSIILADTILAFGGVLGLRIVRRVHYEKFTKGQQLAACGDVREEAVLLIGAGSAGVQAASEIKGRGNIRITIKGFIDDDPRKQRSVVQKIKVLGTTADLHRLVKELAIDHVIISIARKVRDGDIRRIVELCESIPIRVRIIPSLDEILHGNVEINHIRDVRIEDLLGREPVELDLQDMRNFLTAKSVMVTGAGGSIGSELARQVARFGPSKLLLVERSEPALFNIDRELSARWSELDIVPLIADVCDRERLQSVFATYEPQVILHAAAHKHVPMMERNPAEAIKNNVLGTLTLGEVAGESEAEVFVLISTDKAVRPTSVMGASKRVAELVLQHLDSRFGTRFVAVRFGNVIGSAGSVIPIFQDQIRHGGPVTVTHPDMVRYFMTIPEAAQLVLQAGTMSEGGEIFVLDMGVPVSILDLAKDTISLSGLRPYYDIDIKFSGIRPGEKLFEELETNGENMTKTRHPKIFIGKIACYPEQQVRLAVERLALLARKGQEYELRCFLSELLPESTLEGLRAKPELASSLEMMEALSTPISLIETFGDACLSPAA